LVDLKIGHGNKRCSPAIANRATNNVLEVERKKVCVFSEDKKMFGAYLSSCTHPLKVDGFPPRCTDSK
jgi:hypothetical protein